MRNPKKFFEAAAIAAKAIKTMELEGGNEGVRFFFKCFASFVSAPVEAKPAVVPIKQAPPTSTSTTPLALKLVPATAPARILKPVEPAKEFNTDNAMKIWLGQLGGIARGGNAPWKVVQETMARLFRSGVELTADQWQLLFAAMKSAHERGQHIVNNDAEPAKVFAAAPVELVDDYLFGQDGILPSLTGEVADFDQDQMPGWLCAQCSTTLDAIEAVDARQGLGEQEEARVDAFLRAIERKNPPNWLLEKGRIVWGAEEDESVLPATDTLANGAHGVEILRELRGKLSADDNSSNSDPKADARHKAVIDTAEVTASAFSEAVN